MRTIVRIQSLTFFSFPGFLPMRFVLVSVLFSELWAVSKKRISLELDLERIEEVLEDMRQIAQGADDRPSEGACVW
jgi:hypothetical protein